MLFDTFLFSFRARLTKFIDVAQSCRSGTSRIRGFFGRIRIVFGNSSDPGGQNIIRSNPAYCQILFYFLFSGSEPDLSGITDPDLLLWCCCS